MARDLFHWPRSRRDGRRRLRPAVRRARRRGRPTGCSRSPSRARCTGDPHVIDEAVALVTAYLETHATPAGHRRRRRSARRRHAVRLQRPFSAAFSAVGADATGWVAGEAAGALLRLRVAGLPFLVGRGGDVAGEPLADRHVRRGCWYHSRLAPRRPLQPVRVRRVGLERHGEELDVVEADALERLGQAAELVQAGQPGVGGQRLGGRVEELVEPHRVGQRAGGDRLVGHRGEERLLPLHPADVAVLAVPMSCRTRT